MIVLVVQLHLLVVRVIDAWVSCKKCVKISLRDKRELFVITERKICAGFVLMIFFENHTERGRSKGRP